MAAARAAAACESSQQGASVDDATQSCASAPNPEVPALPGKTDLVVWLQMHPVQRQAYQVCSSVETLLKEHFHFVNLHAATFPNF